MQETKRLSAMAPLPLEEKKPSTFACGAEWQYERVASVVNRKDALHSQHVVALHSQHRVVPSSCFVWENPKNSSNDKDVFLFELLQVLIENPQLSRAEKLERIEELFVTCRRRHRRRRRKSGHTTEKEDEEEDDDDDLAVIDLNSSDLREQAIVPPKIVEIDEKHNCNKYGNHPLPPQQQQEQRVLLDKILGNFQGLLLQQDSSIDNNNTHGNLKAFGEQPLPQHAPSQEQLLSPIVERQRQRKKQEQLSKINTFIQLLQEELLLDIPLLEQELMDCFIDLKTNHKVVDNIDSSHGSVGSDDTPSTARLSSSSFPTTPKSSRGSIGSDDTLSMASREFSSSTFIPATPLPSPAVTNKRFGPQDLNGNVSQHDLLSPVRTKTMASSSLFLSPTIAPWQKSVWASPLQSLQSSLSDILLGAPPPDEENKEEAPSSSKERPLFPSEFPDFYRKCQKELLQETQDCTTTTTPTTITTSTTSTQDELLAQAVHRRSSRQHLHSKFRLHNLIQ